MIHKLSSEFNQFKNFGIDLNEANKTANKVKLTTKKAENIVKKGKEDIQEIKNKDKEKHVKKSISQLKNPKNSKDYTPTSGILLESLKLLKYTITQKIACEKIINMK